LLLPPQGSGYYHFGGTDEPDEDAWGQAVTIACLELVGERWLAQFPERARLGYGDISRKTGGRFPPHAEHRLGLDIDIRPVRSDDAEEKVHLGDQAFSREQTKDLVGLFESTCAVHRILFNDHRIAAESERVERARGHGNHLHVALAGPEHQPDAVRERAERLYRWSVLWSPAPRVTAGR
jgi:murein endopeptidase